MPVSGMLECGVVVGLSGVWRVGWGWSGWEKIIQNIFKKKLTLRLGMCQCFAFSFGQ